ncbi:MAG: YdcH family protein [Alphaproteobacteria bacterium]|nr:YdcH family protein [Alphaproteobacteria bacterium]MCY4317815.1 YdcH family protein [Alphaproteobacteria bacterium]
MTDLQDRRAALAAQHAALDEEIRTLENSSTADDLQVQMLKKRKLALKDEIAALERTG